MFRFIVSMMWGAVSAVLVYAANDSLFVNFAAGAVFACLLGLSLWCADSLNARNLQQIKAMPLIARLGTWFLSYELCPAVLVWGLAACGLFVLPHGLGTALAMCLPISLVTLRDYVDLSWLQR